MTEIIFDENEDWEKRILCSDESCIGTIGSDGRCKECSKTYEGRLPAEIIETSVPAEVKAEQKQISADEENDDDWDNRVLCGDESCIGVIGSDGKCRECGKPL